MSVKLHRGLTMRDFPEFNTLISILGGMDARVDIDPADLAA